MKTDDIFEALTDIDDKYIAAAHPYGFDDDQPVVIQPAPRKPLWKILAPIAASLAVIVTAGVFGVKYFNSRPDVETSNPNISASSGITSESAPKPDNTGYQGEAPGLKKIEITTTDVRNFFEMEEFPGYTFGAFNSGIVLSVSEMDVDVTLIEGNVQNLFICDLNGDGYRELCATVRRNGEKCVEAVDFANYKCYTTQLKTQKPCYLNISDNELMLFRAEHDDSGYDYEVSEQLTFDALTQIIPFDGEPVSVGNQPTEFGMEELPDKYFVFENSEVYMRDNSSSDTLLKKIMETGRIFFADLNGDGKRELCGQIAKTVDDDTIEIEIQVTVCDIANGETYFKAFDFTEFKWPVAEVVEIADGELMLRNYDEQNETKFDRSPLTLDMLEKQEKPDYEEVPLVIDQTFTLPDFKGITFTFETQGEYRSFDAAWESCGIGEGGVDNVYLCDLDGNGQREIIVVGPYIGVSGIRVYGYTDDGELGTARYLENDGIRFINVDGKLVCVSENGEEKQFEFKRSDLKPNFATGYSVDVVQWDHTVDYSEIFPWCKKYIISINNRCLKIDGGNIGSYNSGAKMKDIYLVPDDGNDTLLIAYTDAEHDRVVIVRLTADSINSVYLEKGIALKPTSDKLMLADAENGDNIMSLPGRYDKLT